MDRPTAPVRYVSSPPPPEPLQNATFSPPFQLVAPRLRVVIVSGNGDANSTFSFTADFPPASGVDPAKVRTPVWDFGDGTQSVAQDARHKFALPGAYVATATVEDVYGRVAKATVHVGVADNRSFTGLVAAGSGGADQAGYASDATAWDYRDDAVKLLAGATRATVKLAFESKPAINGMLVPADANNLILRVFDAKGNLVASASDTSTPKVLTIDLARLPPGALTLRASGDRGVQVSYTLTALIEYGGVGA